MKKSLIIGLVLLSSLLLAPAVSAQEAVCNISCRNDEQCQDGSSLYFCSQTGLWPWRKACRLKANPKDTSCQPLPTPTPVVTPTPSATPQPSVTPKPSGFPQPSSSTNVCQSLKVTDGNHDVAPSEVSFEASATGNQLKSYVFFFGDGLKVEQSSPTVKHTYPNSGTYYSRVFVKDNSGKLLTSPTCESQVVIAANAIESHRSGCSALYIESGNHQVYPADVTFRVDGYDNKGALKRYKIEYGDGAVEELSDKKFSHQYEEPGTYTVKAYIQDSQGNWKGGDNDCRQTVYVETDVIEKQPETGLPLPLVFGLVGSGVIGSAIEVFRRKYHA